MVAVEEIVRYTYRLRPGAHAVAALEAEWHRCRWLWNEAVHQHRSRRKPTFCKLSRLLTDARSHNTWLRSGSQVAQQQTLRVYAKALDDSFKVKGRGRPKRKGRKTTRPSLEYTSNGFKLRDGRLKLAKGVSIPVVWSRELPSGPKTVRVYQDSVGHWWASFVVRREQPVAPLAPPGSGIGVDWGVKAIANTNHPDHDLAHPEHGRRAARELAVDQRRMARRRRPQKQKPSVGYQKAKVASAGLYAKVARQRRETARVWARRVVADHETIAVEDFKPKFMAKSTMAKKAADGAIGATKRELVERGRRAGRRVVLVPPAYTTMTCASCRARNKQRLVLSERIFRCDRCGHTAGRDVNAARVILATAGLNRVGVDGVSHTMTPSGVDGRAA